MADKMADGQTTKMAAAKAALQEVLRNVPEGTDVGLLVSGAENLSQGVIKGSTYGWAYPLGARDERRLAKAIRLSQPKYKAPLGASIREAAASLFLRRAVWSKEGTYRLLIVTDGQADDPEVVDQYVSQLTTNGILIDVIGVAMTETHLLANKAHRYYRADDPASLKAAVAKVFAEVWAGGLDDVGHDVFEKIAPIPENMAAAMIVALSAGNQRPPQRSAPAVPATPGSHP
jgi:hypothetical protein